MLQRIPRTLAWLLALPLLIGTVAGFASFFPNTPGAAPALADADTKVSLTPRGITCLGYVDSEQGVTALSPARLGSIAEIVVHEGDEVQAGAALLRLEDRSARFSRQQAQAAVEAAQVRLAQAQEAARQHPARLAQQQAMLDAAQARSAAARCLLNRKEELLKSRLITAVEVAAAREQVHEMEALCKVEQGKLDELRLHDAELAVRAAQAEVVSRQAQLQDAEHNLDQCTLTAPECGTVLRVLVGRGTVWSNAAAQPALLFRPAGPLVVRADVEQEFVSQLAVGQTAVVEDEYHSGGAWRGRVQRIADWHTQHRLLLQQPPRFSDVPTVECVIALDSERAPPRLGQRMRVTIGGAAP